MTAPRSLGRRLPTAEGLWEVEPTTSGVTLRHLACGQVVAVTGPILLDDLDRLVYGHDCPEDSRV